MVSRYQRLEPLGDGAYGVVYLAKDKLTGENIALKKIRMEMEDGGIPSTTLREISVLKLLKHENIVELRDVVQSEGRIYLAFEFVDKDLKQYFRSSENPLEPQLVKSWAWQLLKGIEFCHLKGIMHRDLKPQNLLVSKSGVLKIADFGLARAFVPPIRPFTHEIVTLWYRAPEILMGAKSYALPVDMWSVGTIIAEMINKTVLFAGDCEIDELYKIFRILGTPNEDVWPGVTKLPDWNDSFPNWPSLYIGNSVMQLPKADMKFMADVTDMIEQLVQLNPAKRLSARQCIAHPFFDGMMDN